MKQILEQREFQRDEEERRRGNLRGSVRSAGSTRAGQNLTVFSLLTQIDETGNALSNPKKGWIPHPRFSLMIDAERASVGNLLLLVSNTLLSSELLIL